MLLSVMLCSLAGMMLSKVMMALRDMRVVACFFVRASFVLLGCLVMMLGCAVMMLGGFLVMLRAFVFRHKRNLLDNSSITDSLESFSRFSYRSSYWSLERSGN